MDERQKQPAQAQQRRQQQTDDAAHVRAEHHRQPQHQAGNQVDAQGALEEVDPERPVGRQPVNHDSFPRVSSSRSSVCRCHTAIIDSLHAAGVAAGVAAAGGIAFGNMYNVSLDEIGTTVCKHTLCVYTTYIYIYVYIYIGTQVF